MSQSRLIAKNTFYQILAKISTSAIGLISRKLLTNYLGPAGFGDYIYALAFSNLFSAIADWGTLLISIREASKNSREQPQIFGTAIITRLGLSVLATLAALLILPLMRLSPSLSQVTAFATILIIVFALKASLGIIFDTKLRMDRWFFVELLASASTLLLFTITIYFNLPLIWFFACLFAAATISIILASVLALQLTSIHISFNPSLIKQLLLQSLPMGAVLMLFNIYNRVDTLILKSFRSSEEVGFYGLAYFIYENVLLLAAYLMNSSLPLLSREVGSPKFKVYYQKVLDIMLALALPAAIGTIIFSPLLVYIISSSKFISSIPLLRILGISLFFAFLNHVTGFSLVALGKQKSYIAIAATALAFNITANFIFIPLYGAIAAAWITVATEALVQVLTLYLISKSLNFFPSFTSFPKTALEFIKNRGQIF